MASLNIHINGRSYEVSCQDGEEDRAFELGQHFAHKVHELKQQISNVSDSHLLVLTGMMLCDELQNPEERKKENPMTSALAEACDTIEALCDKIEG